MLRKPHSFDLSSFENPQTNSMSPERIHLFFTYFPLDTVAFLSTTLTLSPSLNRRLTLSPFYRFLCVSDLTSHRAQPISCLDDPIKLRCMILESKSARRKCSNPQQLFSRLLKSKEMNQNFKPLLKFCTTKILFKKLHS